MADRPSMSWASFSVAMNRWVTEHDGEWAGVPLPLPGLGLVLEDRHPGAAKIAKMQAIVDSDETPPDQACSADDAGWHVVNEWFSSRRDARVLVLRHDDGRRTAVLLPAQPVRNKMLFGPFETMDAWNLETECNALDRLEQLLTPRMFKAYALTGAFLERSQRSSVHYLFRRLRPTVAFGFGSGHGYFRGELAHGEARIMACLCLHPLGYYAKTFCGAMTPTDDVIAHLLLMRGDERLYWRRANQHPPAVPESGL